MYKLIDRFVRASKLDAHLYGEIGADKGPMSQAGGIVVLSSVAAGIGSIGKGWHIGILMGTAFALIGWFVWACLIYFIGKKIFPGLKTKADLADYCVQLAFQVPQA